jgi:phosphoribosylformylglycinamidine synthase subunit PurQ / glutaminase
MKPRALILHATGTNRDHEAALALEHAGAHPEIVPLIQLRADAARWRDYQMLVLPGGFANADALGAGKLLALDLTLYFAEQVNAFVMAGKPVIGICNGFQALVKAGILPQGVSSDKNPTAQATLAFNAAGHFECRWVTLQPVSQKCVWTHGLGETIYCPIAHGEGNFRLADDTALETLQSNDQIALRYLRDDGTAADGAYPFNPNGSVDDIAGVCNPQGNVLGLMPHPEDHIFNYQHPRHTRGEHGHLGLHLFENGVQYAAQI